MKLYRTNLLKHTYLERVGVIGVMNKQNQFVFYTVEISSLKDILIIDGIIGTVLYYVSKQFTSSEIVGFLASMIGVMGIRKLPLFRDKSK